MTDERKPKADLIKELAVLRQRVSELEAERTHQTSAREMLHASETRYRTLIENLPQKIFLKDKLSTYVICNRNYAADLAISPEGIKGKTDYDFYPPELAEKYRADDKRIMDSGRTEELEEKYVQDGREHIVNTVKTPLKDEQSEVTGILGIFWDVTEKRRLEQQVARQAQEILDIATPVVQVWEGVVAVPLIGSLDSERTQQFMERLLTNIVETTSSVALIDITGVPAIDTQTAQHLIETISAVRLLGAEVILTGVRPSIAQTIVHLGVDLSGVITRPSLVAGLRVALNILDLRVVPKRKDDER